MATKVFCDACGTEIVYERDRHPLKYEDVFIDLCPVCADHFEKWLDGEEKMVNVMEGI